MSGGKCPGMGGANVLHSNAIRNYCISQVSDVLRTAVLRLLELIILRDSVTFLSDSELHKSELCDLINFICTS